MSMNVFELFGSVGLNTENFDKGISDISSSVTDIVGLITTVIGYVKKFDDALTSSTGVMGEVVTTTFEFAKAMDDNVMGVVGKANTAVVGAFKEMTDAAVDFFRSVVDEGMSFDAAMGQVSATQLKDRTDLDSEIVTIDDFTGSLRDLAKYMGSTTKFTATQAAEALNYMALAGYDAKVSATMLPKVLDLAAAGMMDLGYASDIVTDAQTALGIQMGDMTTFVDQLAKTASSSNTSVSQLGEALLTIGSTGRMVRGGFEELNIVLGVLANNGKKGSEAGNDLRRQLTRLVSPTKEAEVWFEKLGFSAYENGKLKALPQIYQELGTALNSLSDERRNMAVSDIFGQYALAGANALLNTTSEQWETLSEKIHDAEGAASDMAKIQQETLPGALTQLQSAFSGVKIEIFDLISPIAREFVVTLTEGFTQAADHIRNGNYFAAFSEVGKTIGKMITDGVNLVLDNEDTINEILLGLVDALSKVGNALFSGGSKLLPRLLSHITFFATNIIRRFSNFLSKEENVKIITDTIQDLIDQANDFFSSNRDQIYNIVSTLIDIAIEFVDDIFLMRRSTIYSILGEKLIDIIENLPDKINEWLSSDGLNDTIDAVFDFVDRLATTLLNSASEILPPLLVFAVNLGTRIIQGIADFLSDEENKEKIIGIINLLTAAIVGFFRENEDSIYSIIDSALDIAERVFPRVFEARREPMAKIIWHVISEIWSRAWNEFANSEEVGKVLGEVWSKFKVWFYGMLGETGTDDFVKGLQKFGLKIWIKIYNWFIETRQKIVDEVTKIKDKIFEVLEENKFLDIGKNIVHGIWKGICSVNNWMYEKITGWANNDVLGWFENAFQIGSPSKVFENRIGVFLAQGIGVGFEEEMDKVQEDMAKSIPTDFDMTPQINTTEKNKTGNFFFEFNIGNMSGISEKDGIAFAETISQLLYSETYRKKEAFS